MNHYQIAPLVSLSQEARIEPTRRKSGQMATSMKLEEKQVELDLFAAVITWENSLWLVGRARIESGQ